MDTSKEYIKMCEKATEIQELFRGFDLTKFPNFAFDKVTDRVVIVIWAPKTLAEKLNFSGNTIVVSIESEREKLQYIPEYPGNWHDSLVWLPGIDQLFMLLGYGNNSEGVGYGGENNIPWHLIELLHFSFNTDIGRKHGDSFEQLLLRYYMYTKYIKTWNGKDWI
jgi:hypothetical protein